MGLDRTTMQGCAQLPKTRPGVHPTRVRLGVVARHIRSLIFVWKLPADMRAPAKQAFLIPAAVARPSLATASVQDSRRPPSWVAVEEL